MRRILSNPVLSRQPTLIIDDEGDEASLNTQFRSGEESSTYRSINALRDSLQIHGYVAYTATPQANLLISGIDTLSPSFGVLIQPGSTYCGGSDFFGHTSNHYIREVSPIESVVDQTSGIPEGLKRALATFIVSGSIRHIRIPDSLHSMLIHNSSLTVDHTWLESRVQELINQWKEVLGYPQIDPAYQEIIGRFHSAYDDLRQTVNTPPAWDQVESMIKNECRIDVRIVNSTSASRDPITHPVTQPNTIFIGGNMLGRGITLEGLSTVYITRRADETNADTMEQRARWFGYKRNYLDICRIYLTPQLREDFSELLRHEDDLWETLRRNHDQGLSMENWRRMLVLNTSLGIRPTRMNVASYRTWRSTGWDIQRKIVINADLAQKNVELVESFFTAHPGRPALYGGTTHTLLPEFPVEILAEQLLSQLHSEGTDQENLNYTEYLMRLHLKGILHTIDILRMSEGNERERARDRDPNGHPIPNKIENPMQGPRGNYPGDRYIHGEKPQLQIHKFLPDNQPPATIAIALYMPAASIYDMDLITRDDAQ